MKIIYSVMAALFVIVTGFSGCGNGSDSGPDSSAERTGIYREVAGDLSGRPVRMEHKLVLHLEALQGHENDTVGVGYDSYRLNVDTPHTHTFCMENDLNRSHRLLIEDAGGKRLLELSSGCAEAELPGGEVQVRIFNGDAPDGITHEVYVMPAEDYRPFKGTVHANESRARSIGRSDLAKTDIIFDRCLACDLHGIDLRHATYADESIQEVSGSMDASYFARSGLDRDAFDALYRGNSIFGKKPDLSGSDLSGADLSYAFFENAVFDGVDFAEANLSHAVFADCSFNGARVEHADMRHTVFVRSTVEKNATLQLQAVSRPSASMLFKNGTSDYDQAFSTALLNEHTIGFYASKYGQWNHKLPPGKTAGSAPVTIPNNFTQGRSTFMLLDDGIYEYLEPYGVHGKPGDIPEGYTWHKVGDSESCEDGLGAMFWNYGGSERNYMIKMFVYCRDGGGKVHFFKRRFLNKYDSHHNSRYEQWSKAASAGSFPAPAQFNSFGEYAYIDSTGYLNFGPMKDIGNFIYSGDYGTDKKMSAEQISGNPDAVFFSLPAWGQSSVEMAVVITEKGENNIYYNEDPSNDHRSFRNYGHPPGVTVVSAPSLGGYRNTYIAVLGDDGHIWAHEIYTSARWMKFPREHSGFQNTSYRRFSENDLTEAFVQAELPEFDFRKETLENTYFYGASLSGADFSGITANGTVFSRSDLSDTDFSDARLGTLKIERSTLDRANFSQAVLHGLFLTGNRGEDDRHNPMKGVNFERAVFSDLNWSGNTAECPRFSQADFSGSIYAEDNRFIGGTDCRPDFTDAVNVPVAFFYGSGSRERNASLLRFHDFTQASFDALETVSFLGANMSGARFHGMVLNGFDMNGSDWSGADIGAARFSNCTLRGAKLDDVNAGGVHFEECDLGGAFLSGDFKAAHISDSDLSGIRIGSGTQMNLVHFASTTTAALEGGGFHKVNLTAAVFSGVEFYGTDFTQAVLESIETDGESKFVECDFTGSDLDSASFGKTLFGGSCFTGVNDSYATNNGAQFRRSGRTDFHQRIFGESVLSALDYNLIGTCGGTYAPNFE